jgi:hypothetical protein
MDELGERDADGGFGALERLSTELKTTLWSLSDSLTAQYFTNLTACRFTASL